MPDPTVFALLEVDSVRAVRARALVPLVALEAVAQDADGVGAARIDSATAIEAEVPAVAVVAPEFQVTGRPDFIAPHERCKRTAISTAPNSPSNVEPACGFCAVATVGDGVPAASTGLERTAVVRRARRERLKRNAGVQRPIRVGRHPVRVLSRVASAQHHALHTSSEPALMLDYVVMGRVVLVHNILASRGPIGHLLEDALCDPDKCLVGLSSCGVVDVYDVRAEGCVGPVHVEVVPHHRRIPVPVRYLWDERAILEVRDRVRVAIDQAGAVVARVVSVAQALAIARCAGRTLKPASVERDARALDSRHNLETLLHERCRRRDVRKRRHVLQIRYYLGRYATGPLGCIVLLDDEVVAVECDLVAEPLDNPSFRNPQRDHTSRPEELVVPGHDQWLVRSLVHGRG